MKLRWPWRRREAQAPDLSDFSDEQARLKRQVEETTATLRYLQARAALLQGRLPNEDRHDRN